MIAYANAEAALAAEAEDEDEAQAQTQSRMAHSTPPTPEPVMGRITSSPSNEEKLDLDEGGWDNSSPLVPPKLTWRGVQEAGQQYTNWTSATPGSNPRLADSKQVYCSHV